MGYYYFYSYDISNFNQQMRKINLTITGCMGRMGQQLIKSVNKDKAVKISSLTENYLVNKKFIGVKPQKNSEIAFKNANVIIDFTVPKCTLEVLKIATKLKKRVVIGTTGFTKKEEDLIKKYSKKIPILKAGNMSVGINLLMYITEIASKSIGKKYLNKKSFPYGKNINFNSIRKGEVVGEHEVKFSSGKEIITLSHEAFDRALYSEGALEAAKWLSTKKPGLYSMRNLLNFK